MEIFLETDRLFLRRFKEADAPSTSPPAGVMERVGLRFVRIFHESWPEPIPGTEEGEVEYELRKEDSSKGRT